MPLDEFRAQVRLMTVAEHTEAFGMSGIEDQFPPDDQLRVYPTGAWIHVQDDGQFNVLIETSEGTSLDLATPERTLWAWVYDDGDEGKDRGERLNHRARAMMATRPELKQMSLNEWLAEYMDQLSLEERRAASAILELF